MAYCGVGMYLRGCFVKAELKLPFIFPFFPCIYQYKNLYYYRYRFNAGLQIMKGTSSARSSTLLLAAISKMCSSNSSNHWNLSVYTSSPLCTRQIFGEVILRSMQQYG